MSWALAAFMSVPCKREERRESWLLNGIRDGGKKKYALSVARIRLFCRVRSPD